MHLAHALAAAAGRCLDEHRVTDAIGEGAGILDVFDHAVGAGNSRDAAGGHRLTGGRFVAHAFNAVGRRADEDEIVVGAGTGEVGVFGEEAVTGVHGFAAGGVRRRNDIRHDQVRLAGRRRSDADRLVGVANGQRVAVGLGIHRDRLHAQLAGRAHDAQGHFAAIGDEDLLEHGIYAPSPASASRYGSI